MVTTTIVCAILAVISAVFSATASDLERQTKENLLFTERFVKSTENRESRDQGKRDLKSIALISFAILVMIILTTK